MRYRRNMYNAYQPRPWSYLQIVESFRTDTGAVRQRVIANPVALSARTEEARSAHRRPEPRARTQHKQRRVG